MSRSPVYLTVSDVASLLRTSHGAIYKMVERGQLPGVVRVRRRVLIDQSILVYWLDQNRASSQIGGL